MRAKCSHGPTRSGFARAAAAALAVALLMWPAAAVAQEIDEEEGRGGGYFQAGFMMLDVDELNASLIGAGYPGLDDSYLTLGGGGFGMTGRFLLGGEGHAVVGSAETTADGALEVRLGGGYGLFRVGYLAYSVEGLDVFPMIGVGGGGMNLSLLERSAPTFDDVLADPQRSSNLSTGTFLLDGSVAVFYRPSFAQTEPDPEEEEDDRGGLLLGLQAGYTFAPGNSSWRLDAINTVAGGPDTKLQGFYVRLSIGGWGSG